MNSEVGQNFLACANGQITTVSFELQGLSTPGDILLSVATGPNTNTPEYQQIVTLAVGFTGILVIPLTTPFPVVAGTQYAISLGEEPVGGGAVPPGEPCFRLENTTDNLLNSGLFGNGGVLFSINSDLSFSISVEPRMESENAIPTLSHWGLLILGLSILNLSLILVFRMHMIISN